MINVKLIIFSENLAQMLTALLGVFGFLLVEHFGETLGLSAYQTATLALVFCCAVGLNADLQNRIRRVIYRFLMEREVFEEYVSRRKPR